MDGKLKMILIALNYQLIYLFSQHDIDEAKRAEERRKMGDCRKFGYILLRTMVWLIVLAIWAGSFYLIVEVVNKWTPEVSPIIKESNQ